MTDALLWIGQSYKTFDCGERGGDCRRPCCFVHEAARRGISRKLGAIGDWATGGETRFFLAYGADRARPELGTIYGYFVLERIEVINHGTPSATADRDRPAGTRDLDRVIREICTTRDRHTTRYVPVDAERRTSPRCCRSGNPRTPHRESIGAIYVVDALCADVTDIWAELARRGVASDFEHMLDRLHGTGARSPRTKVPAGLPAALHGELVLFDEPAVFEAHPHAYSRGLRRIDGEELYRQVEAGETWVHLHGAGSPLTLSGEVV